MNCLGGDCCKNEDEFTDEQWKSINEIIEKQREKPGALIPVLEEVQGITGYLPEQIQRKVAEGLNIPLAQVYGVVTFYSFFTMKPRGKHQVRVCLGTACHVRGGHQIEKELEQDLGIMPGEVTQNREFSLDVVRCLGACGLAPVMMVGDDTYKQVKPVTLNQILNRYRETAEDRED